jgi:diguanylate cyclase (GGDEF)-like protein/PAS domain S-box-containing protein
MLTKNEALTLVSIQHDLTMQVGLSLNLSAMLKKFSRAVSKRLSVKSVHFIFFKMSDADLELREYSLPRSRNELMISNPLLYRAIQSWLKSSPGTGDWKSIEMDRSYYHVFALGETGVVLFRRNHIPISEMILSSLTPVIKRLEVACRACFQHEGLVNEIRRRTHVQEELEKEKTLVQTTLHSIGDAVITTGVSGNIIYMNPVACRMLGWLEEDAKDMPALDVVKLSIEGTHDKESRVTDLDELEALGTDSVLHLVLQGKKKQYDVKVSISPICCSSGKLLGRVISMHDFSHTRKIERELRWQAWHDPLTKLPNRRSFNRQLDTMIQSAALFRTQHALLYIDLDQFKVVNDSCGHMAGDFLLQDIACVMSEEIRPNDVLARVGGDEFALLLPDLMLSEAYEVAERIRQKITAFRFEWEKRVFAVGASIGLIPITAGSEASDQLFSKADVACYAAKEGGRNRVHVYLEGDGEIIRRHGEMEWAGRISKALEEDRFELYCQPVVSLRKPYQTTDHVEVLLRMKEGDKHINPGAFLPAAERHGLIQKIDYWVVSHVIGLLKQTILKNNNYSPQTQININISGPSLSDTDMFTFLLEELGGNPELAKLLCFEITETAAITNLSNCLIFMRGLTKLGCRFALDDFGSGFSSFSYLKNLPVHYLKIDGSFVQDMATDSVDMTLVESIHRTAEALNIEAIAEFVEDAETCRLLQEIGLNYGQGYYFGKPSPFITFLGGCTRIGSVAKITGVL